MAVPSPTPTPRTRETGELTGGGGATTSTAAYALCNCSLNTSGISLSSRSTATAARLVGGSSCKAMRNLSADIIFRSSDMMRLPPDMALAVPIPRISSSEKHSLSRSIRQSGSFTHQCECMKSLVRVFRTQLRAQGRFHLSPWGSGMSGFHEKPVSADTRLACTCPIIAPRGAPQPRIVTAPLPPTASVTSVMAWCMICALDRVRSWCDSCALASTAE
mmetsp:Transcript_30451/g.67339  ORF Transcript_30451/g.67339 Transcript_30451/m.67339 type:complete len:218 (+) Transcript_30451:1127-1780(+)